MWVIFPILCGVRWRIINHDCRYKLHPRKSHRLRERIIAVIPWTNTPNLYHCILYGVCCEFVTALAISQELLLEKYNNLYRKFVSATSPSHAPSKFNMGLKCFYFIPNKLCHKKLCRKIVLSSYDDLTRWGYSWESPSPVRHLTPVYPIYWWTNAGILLAQCCKRRATNRLTLCQRLEFADWLWPNPVNSRHWPNVVFMSCRRQRCRSTVEQHWSMLGICCDKCTLPGGGGASDPHTPPPITTICHEKGVKYGEIYILKKIHGLYQHIIVLQPGILSECMTISFPNELWSTPSFEHWTFCQNTRLAT